MNHTYPFSLSISASPAGITQATKVITDNYNGVELQVGSGYLGCGARMYMPEVGRWVVVSPMAEMFESLSR